MAEACEAISIESLRLAHAILSYPPPLRSVALRLIDAIVARRLSAADVESDVEWFQRNLRAGNTRAQHPCAR